MTSVVWLALNLSLKLCWIDFNSEIITVKKAITQHGSDQSKDQSNQQCIGVVVIGGGYFAHFHINAWLRLNGVRLIAIVETDILKHTALKEKVNAHNSTHTLVTDSLQKALSGGNADIVDIATPPSSHADLIIEATTAGCPYIICQKPFCGTRNNAVELLKKTRGGASEIVIHENFRFQPWYRAIKLELHKNTIGTVLQANFRLRPGDGQGPDAYLARQPYFRNMDNFLIHETGIHYIDVFRYLFGEPIALSAELQRLNPAITGEDAGYFVFHYTNGLRAQFDGNRLLDHAAENTRLTMGEMLIEGTLGSIALYGNGALHLRRFGEPDWSPIEYSFTDNDFGGDCVYHLQKHVTDHLRHNSPLENKAENYLRNLELEDLVYKASTSQTRMECQS